MKRMMYSIRTVTGSDVPFHFKTLFLDLVFIFYVPYVRYCKGRSRVFSTVIGIL